MLMNSAPFHRAWQICILPLQEDPTNMTRKKKKGKNKASEQISSSMASMNDFSNEVVPYRPHYRPLIPDPVMQPVRHRQSNALYTFWAFHRILRCGHIARMPDFLIIHRICPVCKCALEDDDFQVNKHLLIRHRIMDNISVILGVIVLIVAFLLIQCYRHQIINPFPNNKF